MPAGPSALVLKDDSGSPSRMMRLGPQNPYRGGMPVLRHLVEFIRAHPRAADAVLAAAFVGYAVAAGLSVEASEGQRQLSVLGWILLIAATSPIAFRRVAPIASMWAIVVTTIPYWVLDYPDEPMGPALLIAIYSVGAHVERPRSLHHGATASLAMIATGIVGVIAPEEDLPWFAIPAFIIMYGTAWMLGDNLRTRRAYVNELKLAATRTEAHQQAEADRAVAEERTRIARELHDVVAHSMSVMVVQAGAARRVLDSDPKRASDALAAIESTGRESLDEMRQILSVLRSEDEAADLAPAPTLDDFGRLIEHCENAGLPVDIAVEGDSRPLAASLEVSAYRVVQESLTNTLKHAGPAQAEVRLVYTPELLEVLITDDGRGASAAASGAGQGLVGMRERVEAFGGTLRAGPRAGGGYAVTAAFPIGKR